jgi:N-acetyl-alpha-D-glucosaminyl L-malate synthase BshA
LICHPGFGGSARIAVDLANELGRRDHRVFLFARTHPMGITSFAPGVRFIGLVGHDAAAPTGRLEAEWPPRALADFTRRIIRIAEDAPLDVLHFHYAVPFAEVAEEVRLRLGRRPRLVGTLHGTDVTFYGARRHGRRELAKQLSCLDAVTTVSRNYAHLSARVFRLPEPPVVVPNFVDLDRFHPPLSENGHRRRARILHVSNFRPVKHPEMVARVYARVRREVDAELWLVGEGDGLVEVQQLTRAAGLERDVRMWGLRRDVETIARQADVLLITSRAESFCLAALEAAACGVPAVASRVGGLPEAVVDGKTGVLFESGDESEAARAVVRLLTDEAQRHFLGTAAVAQAGRFSATAVVPRYEELYWRLANRAPTELAEAVS